MLDQTNQTLQNNPKIIRKAQEQQLNQLNIIDDELKHSSSKKQKNDLKLMKKQRKAKDIKISTHKLPINIINKSIQNSSQLSKSIITIDSNNKKNLNYNSIYEDEGYSMLKPLPSQQIKKSNHRNEPYLSDKEKEKIILEKIKDFNPISLNSNQSQKQSIASINREKIERNAPKDSQQKRKNKQIRSQNKVEKSRLQNSNSGAKKALFKQNSHNFLDKNHYIMDKNISYASNVHNNGNIFDQQINMKLDQRLHLPSLVNVNTGQKNIKGKFYQNITSLNNESNYDHQKYVEIPIEPLDTDKLSLNPLPNHIGQKVIKIPIQKLKALKPEEIKLKYQKKIKQEQRNRAKDIAMHIFNREQEEQQRNRDNNEYVEDILYADEQGENNPDAYTVDSRSIHKQAHNEQIQLKKNNNIFSKHNPEILQDKQQGQYQIKTTLKKQKINHKQSMNRNKYENIFKKNLY